MERSENASFGGALVSQPVINFIGYETDAEPLARRANRGKDVAGEHGAGRISRAHQEHAIEALLPMLRLDHLRGHGKPGCCRDRQWHRD